MVHARFLLHVLFCMIFPMEALLMAAMITIMQCVCIMKQVFCLK